MLFGLWGSSTRTGPPGVHDDKEPLDVRTAHRVDAPEAGQQELAGETVIVTGADSSDSSRAKGAIDEETGEVNWDCPCLQAALAPPCGEFFRAAFSCFAASKAQPRGSDCVEQFLAMTECYRAHPEVYLRDDDTEEDKGSHEPAHPLP